jgi:hypothetical protein
MIGDAQGVENGQLHQTETTEASHLIVAEGPAQYGVATLAQVPSNTALAGCFTLIQDQSLLLIWKGPPSAA